ncbi:MAG TPA: FprA family A-type flavoprotein [Candidatus Cloacimonadota bacterium]|nr:FprA family A-type flavoprotein [Candidatus Cloacimonadota bacterium]
MFAREIKNKVYYVGVQDWGRRLFDSLIPLPDGTSYNSYLVKGSEKTAIIDTVDPDFAEEYLQNLEGLDKLDYIITLHSEQDHSGSIPILLNRFPQAQVVCSPKAVDLLKEHLGLDPAIIRAVEDGEIISLGDKSLLFIHTPWVHWPETMVAYMPETRILFSCDFLGSHSAGTDLYDNGDPLVMEAAKRYYAEIMMPFKSQIRGNLKKVRELNIELIANSHGPIWNHPEDIISAYEDWVSDRVDNKVVIPYISMHGSTRKMVDYLTKELVSHGVKVELFDLAVTDIGKLAMALVDAATIVIGSPTVHVGPHPIVAYATLLANAIKPKARYAAVIGSYGWANKLVDGILGLMPGLKPEVLGAVICKGEAKEPTLKELSDLATLIAEKHKAL